MLDSSSRNVFEKNNKKRLLKAFDCIRFLMEITYGESGAKLVIDAL